MSFNQILDASKYKLS